MKNKKITKLLSSLNTNEMDQFALFLEARYFVAEETPGLYLALLRGQVLEGEEEVGEEELSGKLFPGEAFDYRKMARLNTQMVRLFYQFLAVNYVKENELPAWGLVLDHLGQRQQGELLDLSLSAIERAINRAPESSDRLYRAYRLLDVQVSRPPGEDRQTTFVPGSQVRAALDEYYELAQLRLECSALNRQLALGDRGEEPAPSPTSDSKGPSLPQLYRLVRANLEAPADTDRLRALHEGLSQALHQKPSGITPGLKEICTYALNGSVRLVNLNSGAEGPRRLLQGVYKQQLDAGVLLENDRLPSYHFKNIVQNLVLIGEFEQAERTISEYAGRLPDDYQNNAAEFARGYLAYHKGDFPAAKNFFHTLLSDHKDIFYGLDGRLMYLRTLFELGDLAFLESFSESFRQFLRRRRVSAIYQKLYSEANRNIARLARIQFGSPDRRGSRLKKFREEIEGAESVLLKDWLLERAQP